MWQLCVHFLLKINLDTVRYEYRSNSHATSCLFNTWTSCVLAKSSLVGTRILGRSTDIGVTFPSLLPSCPSWCNRAELFSVHIGGFPWEGSANLEVSGSPRGYLDAGHAGSLPLERSKVWPAAGRPSRGWNEISGGKGGAGRGFGSSGAHSMGLAGKICWKDVVTCLGFSA